MISESLHINALRALLARVAANGFAEQDIHEFDNIMQASLPTNAIPQEELNQFVKSCMKNGNTETLDKLAIYLRGEQIFTYGHSVQSHDIKKQLLYAMLNEGYLSVEIDQRGNFDLYDITFTSATGCRVLFELVPYNDDPFAILEKHFDALEPNMRFQVTVVADQNKNPYLNTSHITHENAINAHMFGLIRPFIARAESVLNKDSLLCLLDELPVHIQDSYHRALQTPLMSDFITAAKRSHPTGSWVGAVQPRHELETAR